MLVVLIGYGGMVVSSEVQAHQKHEERVVGGVMDRWNQTCAQFDNVSVEVRLQGIDRVALHPNRTDDYIIKRYPPYPHVKLYALVSVRISTEELTDVRSTLSPLAYNLTTNATLIYTISSNSSQTTTFPDITLFRKSPVGVNEKMCRIQNYGIWDVNSQTCFTHFILSDLCFVYNLTTNTIEHGCFDSVEQWVQFDWFDSNPPQTINTTVGLTVRASSDPLLADTDIKAATRLHNAKEVLIGAAMTVIGCLLLLLPIVYFWQVLRNKDERLLKSRGLELAQSTEGYMPRY